MIQIFYLLGGEDIKRRSMQYVMREIFSSVKNPKVLVIPWTTDNEEKVNYYKNVLEHYFNDLGAVEVKFLKRNPSYKEIDQSFKNKNILYLPGGDPAFFLEELRRNPLVIEKIRNFKGILIGNSAGAIVLCKQGFYKDESYNGLGILGIKIRVHFKEEDLSYIDNEEFCLREGEYLRIVRKINT